MTICSTCVCFHSNIFGYETRVSFYEEYCYSNCILKCFKSRFSFSAAFYCAQINTETCYVITKHIESVNTRLLNNLTRWQENRLYQQKKGLFWKMFSYIVFPFQILGYHPFQKHYSHQKRENSFCCSKRNLYTNCQEKSKMIFLFFIKLIIFYLIYIYIYFFCYK